MPQKTFGCVGLLNTENGKGQHSNCAVTSVKNVVPRMDLLVSVVAPISFFTFTTSSHLPALLQGVLILRIVKFYVQSATAEGIDVSRTNC